MKKVVVAMAIALSLSPAHARIVDEDPLFEIKQSNSDVIQHVGNVPNRFMVFRYTFTNKDLIEGLPLQDALKKIIPNKFDIQSDSGVSLNINVKPTVGLNWVETLLSVLVNTGYKATIDWDKLSVYIHGGSAIYSDTNNHDKNSSATNVVHEQQPSHSQPIVGARGWTVTVSDGLLSAVLERWCKQATGECYKFVNQATVDMEIDAEVSFEGDFKQALVALTDAVNSWSGGKFRLRLTPNKVLVLSDVAGPAGGYN